MGLPLSLRDINLVSRTQKNGWSNWRSSSSEMMFVRRCLLTGFLLEVMFLSTLLLLMIMDGSLYSL